MTRPPFTLTVLGPPRLEGPGARDAQSAGPRRLALLAVVAASGHIGITRDRLLGMLWPDADQDRARRALNQALYTLRRDAKVDLLVGTTDLRLDLELCSADVVVFDQAIATQAWADALAVYAGPMLDGFFLSDAPEFGSWLDTERHRRARQAVAAAEAVAVAAEQAQSAGAAVAAWRRAVELDPFSGRVARQLMQAMAKAGDRAGAIRHAEQHAAFLQRELETAPDATVLQLAEELRRQPAVFALPAAPIDAGAASTDAVVVPDSASSKAAAARQGASPDAAVGSSAAPSAPETTAVFDGSTPTATPAPLASPRPRWRRVAPWAAVGAVLLAGAAAVTRRTPVPYAVGEYIVLGDFVNLTSDTLLTRTAGAAFAAAVNQSRHVAVLPRAQVAEALLRMRRTDTTDLLAPALAREVAIREQVPLVVTGEVLEAGGQLQVTTHLVLAESGAELRTRSRRIANRQALLGALDGLAADLREDLGDARSSVRAATPLPRLTTSSLEALRLYADALRALRENDLTTAMVRLEGVLAIDSNFAQARSSIGSLLVRNNQPKAAEPHFEAALRLAEKLPRTQALPILAQVNARRGRWDLAIDYIRASLALQPQNSTGWLQLGAYLRRAERPVEALAAFDSAAARFPLDKADQIEVAGIWLDLGTQRLARRDAFDSSSAHFGQAFAIDPSQMTYLFLNHMYGSALVGAGRPDSARVVFSRMLALAPNDKARGLRSLGYLAAWEGRWRTAGRYFEEAAAISRANQQWTSALRNEALAGTVLLHRGQRDAGLAMLRRAATTARTNDVEPRMARFAAVALAQGGDRAAAEAFAGWIRGNLIAGTVTARPAMLQVESQVLLGARRYPDALDSARAAFAIDSTGYGRAILAATTAAYGDLDGAIRLYEALRRQFGFGEEYQFAWQLAPYWIGRWHEERGRAAEAMAAYERFVAAFPAALPPDEPPEAVADARSRLNDLRAAGQKLR